MLNDQKKMIKDEYEEDKGIFFNDLPNISLSPTYSLSNPICCRGRSSSWFAMAIPATRPVHTFSYLGLRSIVFFHRPGRCFASGKNV